jgi:hypothetical protein
MVFRPSLTQLLVHVLRRPLWQIVLGSLLAILLALAIFGKIASEVGGVKAGIVLGCLVALPVAYRLVGRVEVRDGYLVLGTLARWRTVPLTEVTGVALFAVISNRGGRSQVAVIHGQGSGVCMLSRRFWSDSTIVGLRAAVHCYGGDGKRLPAGAEVRPAELELRYQGILPLWWRRPNLFAWMLVLGILAIATPLLMALGFKGR